jgi:hypothetical protein
VRAVETQHKEIIMRRIPVDCTKVRFLGTGKVAERAKYAELSDGSRRRVPDAQDTDDQGRPMWVVDVLVDDPEADRAEIASVKVASYEVPETTMGVEVRFTNLTALPYVLSGQNRVSLSFNADGIERAQQPKAA